MRNPIVAVALVLAHAALVAADLIPQYDVLLHVPVTIAFAWLLRDAPHGRRLALATTYFLVFAAAAYACQLSTGMAGRHALVAGTIPWSDAQGFLSNAWRALFGLPLSTAITGTAMRPLYPLSLAATLAMVGYDVKIALSLYAAVVAVLMARAATRIGERYGWHAFAGASLVLAWALRRHSFVFSTESLGLVAGLIAFELFVLAVETDRLRRGLLLPSAFLALGMGLMARPGPVLAVPLLVVWVGKRAGLRAAAACTAAVGIGFASNALVVRGFGDASSPIGGEFPPILYGALHGEDFTALAQRHPEMTTLPTAARPRAALGIIAGELRERPWLVLALGRGGLEYAVSPRGIFSFGYYDPDDAYFERAPVREAIRRAGPYRVANLVAMAAGGAAFVVATWLGLRRRRTGASDPVAEAAHVVFGGALLSACLTPPWITETAQLQTTTLPFFAILPWIYRSAPETAPPPHLPWAAPALLGGWLAISFAFLGTRRPAIPERACGADDTRAFFVEPSLFVRVTAPGEAGYTIERMRANLAIVNKHNPKLVAPLAAAARPGLGIEMVFDGCAQRAAVLLDEADALAARRRGWVYLKGKTVDVDGRVFDLR